MPRLIGRPSRTPLYTLVTFLVIVVAATTAEYLGAIDLVPDFGRDNPTMRIPDLQNPRSRTTAPSNFNS